ncbi:ATP-dependent RNA helicase DDX51 isoform X3 [Myotis myotis]|uniref:ATP-dependent RNA helicase DDX51 isoform X3 n=1 Tax=Myotis myotis TaxID=51298 RepID=UPI00174C0DD2|nr:ATP-dependent RNA helicase DDX51 isoform X3 [Myotis myotis]
MALFYVARYAGPEAAGAEAEAEADGRARALLERLQCRARERQRQQQSRPQEPEEAAQTEGAASRRRRRRPRRCKGGGAPGSPQAPRSKRRREAGEEAGAGGPAGRGGDGARTRDLCRLEADAPPARLPPAESSEEAPREGSVDAEAAGPPGTPGEQPSGEARGPPAHALLLGGFGRSRAPKVQPFLPTWLAQPSCVGRNVTEDLVPIEDVPEVHPDLQRKLRAHGISSYFPVQAAVIPALLESAAQGFLVARGGYQPRDLCVSAPTGSGKTLAFVIPVVQALLQRAVCQVRALVVLPTKELAQQVSKVFNVYTDATPLRVALVTGQKSLAKEQEGLVQKTVDGFRCLADIVVATPGRLVDHVDQTPGFSLQHLRFLVIDEADRMIDSMHQSWLPRVVAAAFPGEGAKDPFALLQRRQPQVVTAASTCCPQMPLQKLLFSATLTQNPEKLQQLGLHQPWLFSTRPARGGPGDADEDADSGGKYTFPAGLSHHYVPCRLRAKPLVVLHLILHLGFSRILCFTNSRENSHRLFLLVQAFGGVTVAEFSSRYGPGQRKGILKQFEQGKIQLLISTDATARGIDVQGVQLVVNYDAPQYLRTYVHRVGRTARAGNTGQAFTLLLKVQERRFLRMLTEAGVPELERHDTPSELLQPLVPQYEEALSQLERAVKEEWRQKAA